MVDILVNIWLMMVNHGNIWGFPAGHGGISQNGWSKIMGKIPSIMDDFSGTPISGKLHMKENEDGLGDISLKSPQLLLTGLLKDATLSTKNFTVLTSSKKIKKYKRKKKQPKTNNPNIPKRIQKIQIITNKKQRRKKQTPRKKAKKAFNMFEELQKK